MINDTVVQNEEKTETLESAIWNLVFQGHDIHQDDAYRKAMKQTFQFEGI